MVYRCTLCNYPMNIKYACPSQFLLQYYDIFNLLNFFPCTLSVLAHGEALSFDYYPCNVKYLMPKVLNLCPRTLYSP